MKKKNEMERSHLHMDDDLINMKKLICKRVCGDDLKILLIAISSNDYVIIQLILKKLNKHQLITRNKVIKFYSHEIIFFKNLYFLTSYIHCISNLRNSCFISL